MVNNTLLWVIGIGAVVIGAWIFLIQPMLRGGFKALANNAANNPKVRNVLIDEALKNNPHLTREQAQKGIVDLNKKIQASFYSQPLAMSQMGRLMSYN
jgi:hypothetical protein